MTERLHPVAGRHSVECAEEDWSAGLWERDARSRLIRQRLSHDCGVASLAMASGCSYEAAAQAFERMGLHLQRGKKAPWSSNFSEIIAAAGGLDVNAKRQRWRSWRDLSLRLGGSEQCLAILKVMAGAEPGRNWHWVVAEQTPVVGLLIRDPASPLAGHQLPLENVLHRSIDTWRPYGDWILCAR